MLCKIFNIKRLSLCIIFYYCFLGLTLAESPNFPYSLKSITSGPVALSLGGTSIANVYDPSAAIHNPANLVFNPQIQVTISTYSAFHKETSDINDEHYSVFGTKNVNEFHLAYCGISYPFQLFAMNMVAGVSYYPKFSFERSVVFNQKDDQEMTDQRLWYLNQHGYMSAISFSYGIQIYPQFALGVNCNLWRDDLLDNQWKQDISMHGYRQNGAVTFTEYQNKTISNEDKGINLDFGLLWKIVPQLSAGVIFQTRRSNDINCNISEQYGFDDGNIKPIMTNSPSIQRSDDIQIPMTLGLGLCYAMHDNWKMLMDFRQMYWENFHYTTQQQNTTEFISGRSYDTHKKLRSHHLSMGSEYSFKACILSLDSFFRMGFSICTDRGSVLPEPDSVFGMGFGLKGKQLDFNFGYQYQRYAQQEQAITSDGILKSNIRNNVIELSISYRIN